MRIRTSELTGPALDWAVAKAEGSLAPLGNLYLEGRDLFIGVGGDLGEPGQWVVYRPSTDWAQGGPIIEREIHTLIERDGDWKAECYDGTMFCLSLKGPTSLISAMRTFVASKLGAEVEVPNQLLEGAK